MPVFEHQSFLPVPAAALYRYHAQPGAFDRLVPPWQRISTLASEGGIDDGATRLLRLQKGPFHLTWRARHQGHVPGAGFVDVQEEGPFRQWVHEHVFLPERDGAILLDRINWDLPAGLPLKPLIQRDLTRLFAFRHRRTREDLLRQAPYHEDNPLEIVLCGRITPFSAQLAAFLSTAGHRVYRLRYHAGNPSRYVMEDFYTGLRSHPLEDAAALIYTGRLPKPGEDGQDDPLAFWDFLDRALTTINQRPKVLIEIRNPQLPLDAFARDPALRPESQRRVHRDAEDTQRMLEHLSQLLPRQVTLHLGLVLGAPYAQLLQQLLHLECFLFLNGGAVTPEFGWIAQDDAFAAILHTICSPSINGDYAVLANQLATRAEFQRLLLKRSFLAYSWHRLLRVLPWASPGQSSRLSELIQLTPLQETGFRPLCGSLAEALNSGLGV